jgi:hypothetical protein
VLALSAWLLLAGSAGAYVGPGAGLDFLPYVWGLAAWVLTAFSAVLLWPVYAFLRRLRGGAKKPAAAPPADDQVTSDDKVTSG